MKKPSSIKLVMIVIVILLADVGLVFGVTVASMFSDWKIFNDESTEFYAQANPYETVVFLYPEDGVDFTTQNLTAWQADVERLITLTAGQTDVPKIVDIDCDLTFLENEAVQAYPVLITFANLPEVTVDKKVSPLKIEYTQTVFNPLSLLPASGHFDYGITYMFERRHSSSNAALVTEDENSGASVYMWTNTDPIIITDVYPNRLLPYLLILLAAPALGVITYLTCRYCDCKKATNPVQ